MNFKKIFQDINPFNALYTEKDAIRGHSVDRYEYACQLINENTTESLIEAYAWLNVAAQETDMEEDAKLQMHQIGYELKKRGSFDEASIKSHQYYDLYSPEAVRTKIYKSKNPVNYSLRLMIVACNFLVNQVEFFDERVIKKRGNSFFWGLVGTSSSIIGMIAIYNWMKTPGYFTSLCLVLSLFSCIFSAALYEDRFEKDKG